jgi:hypothetical protein
MDSLKKYSERLGPMLGLTPSALYERQRQLVRLKLLKAPATVGPGGGIRATPQTVAMLLVAVLATDNLSDLTDTVRKTAHLRAKSGRCPLTQAASFYGALTRVLADPMTACDVNWIEVFRTSGEATITFDAFKQRSEFGSQRDMYLSVRADIMGSLLSTIANDLKQQAEQQELEQ